MTKAERGAGSRQGKGELRERALRFSPVNAFVGLAGLIALTLGYVLLSQGSVTAAPLLLVLGYVVLIPLAIIL
jgi:hypothetical protein